MQGVLHSHERSVCEVGRLTQRDYLSRICILLAARCTSVRFENQAILLLNAQLMVRERPGVSSVGLRHMQVTVRSNLIRSCGTGALRVQATIDRPRVNWIHSSHRRGSLKLVWKAA